MNSVKKVNPWLEHVKSYQAKNKCTYAVALKEAKTTYKKVSKAIDLELEVKEEPCHVKDRVQTPAVNKRRLKKVVSE